jgi:hypothetical protein
MYTCGMPSKGEVRKLAVSGVGGIIVCVGTIVSTVEVGSAVGRFVGGGVEVCSRGGICVTLEQAARKRQEAMRSFFMDAFS